jgi:hypothetical protein
MKLRFTIRDLLMIVTGCLLLAPYWLGIGHGLAPGHPTILRTAVIFAGMVGAVLAGAGIGSIFERPVIGMFCDVVAYMSWVVMIAFDFARFMLRR